MSRSNKRGHQFFKTESENCLLCHSVPRPLLQSRRECPDGAEGRCCFCLLCSEEVHRTLLLQDLHIGGLNEGSVINVEVYHLKASFVSFRWHVGGPMQTGGSGPKPRREVEQPSK